jgi:hypothetical protein
VSRRRNRTKKHLQSVKRCTHVMPAPYMEELRTFHGPWRDAFNKALEVGDRVCYARKADGGLIYVVGHIKAPASTGFGCVQLELTENSVKLIDCNIAWKLKTGERTRPTSRRIATIATASLIRLREAQDVPPITKQETT